MSPLSPTSPISPTNMDSINERSLSISTQSTQSQESHHHPTYTPIRLQNSENFHPDFLALLRHLEARLSPLVSCDTGKTHPDFPATMLAFNLLTHEQCDALCRHFHQVWPPVRETGQYPVPIRPWIGSQFEAMMDLDTKRRRIGQFIGLSGCESPIYEAWEDHVMDDAEDAEYAEDQMDMDADVEMDETLAEMQQEWEEALRRAIRDEGHRFGQK